MDLLLVEDDRLLARALSAALTSRGYSLRIAADGARALSEYRLRIPEATLLDLGLPDIDGLDLIPKLRLLSDGPIIVISARREMTDKIEALNVGADDYVTKPFAVQELVARLSAVSRRSGTPIGRGNWRVGSALVDVAARVVQVAGRSERLTAIEWALLEVLLAHPGELVATENIIRQVWGPDVASDDAARLRVHMTHIRRKLGLDSRPDSPLMTHPGQGYSLAAVPNVGN